jgi:hypothetical protein
MLVLRERSWEVWGRHRGKDKEWRSEGYGKG